MTVSTEIKVGERPQALSLPAEAIREAASAHPWVLLIESGRAVRQPLSLGLKGEGRVEVIAGLQPDARVIPAAAPVAEGDRVRPIR